VADGQSSNVANSSNPVRYEMSFDMPSEMLGYTRLTIVDEIPAGMTLSEGALTLTRTGGNLPGGTVQTVDPSAYTTAFVNGSLYVTLTSGSAIDLGDLAGQTLTLSLAARFTAVPVLGTGFTNTGYVVVNGTVGGNGVVTGGLGGETGTQGDTWDTETVTYTDFPAPSDFNKEVAGEDGIYGDELTIKSLSDEIFYRVRFDVPSTIYDWQQVTITDDLPDVLELKGGNTSSVAVYTSPGAVNLLTSAGAVTYDDTDDLGLITFKFNNEFDFTSLEGQTVVMSYTTVFRTGVTESDVAGEPIVNNAGLLVEGDEPGPGPTDPTGPTEPTGPTRPEDPPVVVVPMLPDNFTKMVATNSSNSSLSATAFSGHLPA
jgi:fimbrial isopeptide formation D2 family protein